MPSSTYARADMGSAALACHGPFEAGSYQALVVTYTAGPFGVDDMGGLKICFRITSDMTRPQMTDPTAAGYTTAVASNGARLKLTFDWANIRPWQNSLRVQVLHGYLREGDTIKICLGDRSFGGRGMRMQSNVEQDAPLKVFVDAFAAYEFAEIEHSPTLQIVPGPAESISLILSGRRRPGEAFRLGVVPLDRWHNPTALTGEDCELAPSLPVEGLAASFDPADVTWPLSIENLKCHEKGVLTIDLLRGGKVVARSNPMSIDDRKPNIYWADLHGQSGETVGAGTAEEYFRFGRDQAFLDACAHQANDFQVSDEFWAELNALSARFHEPGRYVTLAGYEWSANTALGGDHNVYYAAEGLPIYRSSNVLTGRPQEGTECRGVNALFEAMRAHDAVLMAHVGGRYADLARGHDPTLVRAVEVHSTWGTFEWLLHDALELGYRPGVVAQSDDHKGRPGLAWPGSGSFGAIGGLTAYCMPDLSRPQLIEAIRKRRCYATTGARILLDVEVQFDEPLLIFDDDPALGSTGSRRGKLATPGSIVQSQSCTAALRVKVHGTAPLERIDVFDGRHLLGTDIVHPVPHETRRIRVHWQGAEYRGRGRQTVWDGTASLIGNRLVDAQPVNMLNPEKPLRARLDAGVVEWSSVTTGNAAGVDLWLERPREGRLKIATPVASAEVSLGGLSKDGLVVDAGGLGRQLRILPYAEKPTSRSFETSMQLRLERARAYALYIRVTQCDGHQAWSTPVYLI